MKKIYKIKPKNKNNKEKKIDKNLFARYTGSSFGRRDPIQN